MILYITWFSREKFVFSLVMSAKGNYSLLSILNTNHSTLRSAFMFGKGDAALGAIKVLFYFLTEVSSRLVNFILGNVAQVPFYPFPKNTFDDWAGYLVATSVWIMWFMFLHRFKKIDELWDRASSLQTLARWLSEPKAPMVLKIVYWIIVIVSGFLWFIVLFYHIRVVRFLFSMSVINWVANKPITTVLGFCVWMWAEKFHAATREERIQLWNRHVSEQPKTRAQWLSERANFLLFFVFGDYISEESFSKCKRCKHAMEHDAKKCVYCGWENPQAPWKCECGEENNNPLSVFCVHGNPRPPRPPAIPTTTCPACSSAEVSLEANFCWKCKEPIDLSEELAKAMSDNSEGADPLANL